jgi:hypothetical protein
MYMFLLLLKLGLLVLLIERSDQNVSRIVNHWLLTGRTFEFQSSEVYSIQHYVIKFVSDLRQVSSFLRVLRFPPPINWPSQYIWNTIESGVNEHKPNPWKVAVDQSTLLQRGIRRLHCKVCSVFRSSRKSTSIAFTRPFHVHVSAFIEIRTSCIINWTFFYETADRLGISPPNGRM